LEIARREPAGGIRLRVGFSPPICLHAAREASPRDLAMEDSMNTSDKPLKTESFGACTYAKISPTERTAETQVINVVLSFEEALKLGLAIDECVRQLNRYNRATSEGKNAGLKLIVHFDKKRIRVQEGSL
jgi:hypothetical protein